MKTTLSKPITTFLLTVRGVEEGKPYKQSQRVSTAKQAADFYVLMKGGEWWKNRGCLCAIMPSNTQGLPDRYQRWDQRDAKLMRRVLPIFQRVLP
jgi:hypothetical protein